MGLNIDIYATKPINKDVNLIDIAGITDNIQELIQYPELKMTIFHWKNEERLVRHLVVDLMNYEDIFMGGAFSVSSDALHDFVDNLKKAHSSKDYSFLPKVKPLKENPYLHEIAGDVIRSVDKFLAQDNSFMFSYYVLVS